MNQLIRNLPLSRKFLVLATFALLALALPCTLLLRVDLANLRTIDGEQAGLDPARAVIELAQATRAHRTHAAAVLGGDAAEAGRRVAAAQDVRAKLDRARLVIAVLGSDVAAQERAVATAWKDLEQAVAAGRIDAATSQSRHEALVQQQLMLLEDVAHASGLSLHPEASGYHLQMAALFHLPQMTEALARVRALGTALLGRGVVQPADRERLRLLAEQARLRFQDAQRSLALAEASAGPSTRALLQAPYAAARTAVTEAIGLTAADIVDAATPARPAAAYFEAMTRAVDAQGALTAAALQALGDDLQQMERTTRQRLLLVAGAIAACLLACGWIMAVTLRTTSRAVHEALALSDAVARGELDHRTGAPGRDEIGRLLDNMNRMRATLADVVRDVRSNAESVAAASGQIAQGNQDLSHRTEMQASSLQQTAASMEQLSTTIRSNAEHAQRADRLAQDACDIARRGGETVGGVVTTMQAIEESSRRIEAIIRVIDGIAFQTNILALNAAVEAARAGEQGRGFAVVASEVRALARRSADAASEVRGLISTSTERITLGAQQVADAGSRMGTIVESVQQVAALLRDISRASAEQSAGVAQVGEAVAQMDRGTQQNSALVEESAAAADSLRQQADQLVRAVAAFRLPPGAAAAR